MPFIPGGFKQPPVKIPILDGPVTNIVLIIGDDLGKEQHSSATGGLFPGLSINGQAPSTPNVDAFAAAGVQFERFFLPAFCSPARACLATGRWSYRNGIGEVIEDESVAPLRDGEVTIWDIFGALGYRTSCIGKLHLGNELTGEELAYQRLGIEYHAGPLRNIPGYGAGGSYYAWDKYVQGELRRTTKFATTDTTDDAILRLRRHYQTGSPFFSWIAYNAPHDPWQGPPSGTYDAMRWGTLDPAYAGAGGDAARRPYFKANVECFDFNLGRLFAEIDFSNTLVFLLYDNGTIGSMLAQETHPTKGAYSSGLGKRTPYEPGICVPCWARGAGVVSPGRSVSGMLHAVDLFRTIFAMIGLDEAELAQLIASIVPRDPNVRLVDGRDMSFMLSNEAGSGRDYVICETFSPNGPNPGSTSGLRCIRGPRYKLVFTGNWQTGPRTFLDLDDLDATNRFENNPTAPLPIAGLTDSDPSHPGAKTAYDSLAAALQAEYDTYNQDLPWL